ncbi:hypothetical protein [Paenibacillus kandeliae]|uniref:hypothetical protein n=1 Tax=Paenibacillus kandeliae TaxID=3231269 RepID=UPI0034581468
MSARLSVHPLVKLVCAVALLLVLSTGLALSVNAASTKGNTYSSVSLYINGELQIVPPTQKVQFMNSNTLYIPVKTITRIPGITINYGSPLSLTGSRGNVTINNTNSFAYNGTTYVQYKTLLSISDLDGKYASSAYALFLWTTDEGKAESSKILTNISQLPSGMGPLIGQKMYPAHENGAYWITNVYYDPSSTIFYVTARNSGGEEIHTNSNYEAFDFVLDASLTQMQNILRGKNVWFDNREFNGTGLKHLEKLTFVSFQISDDNKISVVLRKANGNKVAVTLHTNYDVSKMLSSCLFGTNPRSVYKWSEAVWNSISNNRVSAGMTPQQVVLSWGMPSDRNTYQSAGLVYEQWIYPHNYLYFWNGKLTSGQSF